LNINGRNKGAEGGLEEKEEMTHSTVDGSGRFDGDSPTFKTPESCFCFVRQIP
jgi:hypothetical protein